jgi:hypothetical protein
MALRILISLALLLVAGLGSGRVHAAVELLAGSSPQRAQQGVDFAPIRARVTDAAGNAVAGARVIFSFGPWAPIAIANPPSGCFPDAGWNCWLTTDSAGIAALPTLYGTGVGEHTFSVRAYTSDSSSTSLGSAPLTLIVDPFVDPPALAAYSGSGQRAVAGTTFAPFVAEARDAQGRPMAGVEVSFYQSDGVRARFSGGAFSATALTDANGLAFSPPLQAGAGVGSGALRAYMASPGTHYFVDTRFEYTITTSEGLTALALQDMWWSGFDESGWGVSIAQHDDRLFSVIYAYDANGRPTWYVLPHGTWGDRFVTYGGYGFSPRGTPFFAYDATQFRAGRQMSYIHFTFNGERAARLLVDVGEARSIKSLVRQDFSSDAAAPMTGLADMWWGGPAQNGWGIAIMEQPGGLFAVWLTYDEQGLPTWFVMPAGDWTDRSTYEGVLYRTSGPGWPNYDKSSLRVTAAGSFRLRFHDQGHATFTYSVDAHAGSMEIERQPF